MPRSEIHLLRGPNGCGKSLLFDVISGIHRDNGVVLAIDQQRPGGSTSHDRWQLGVRRLFQSPRLPDSLSLDALLERVRANTSVAPDWGKYLFDVYRAAGVSTVGTFGSLSFGQKRFAELVLTVSNGRAWLLDEPFAGFSATLRQSAIDLVNAAALRGAALLVTDHLNCDGAMRFDQIHDWVFPARERAENAPETGWSEMLETLGKTHSESNWTWSIPQLTIGERLVVRDGGFRLRAGEMLLLTGVNGSGKSTLLRALANLEQPWVGIRSQVKASAMIEDIFVSPQPPKLVGDISVVGNLGLMLRSQPARLLAAHRLLNAFGLGRVFRQPAEVLSGGESAIVAIIGAVLSPARVIILDEPFESLAPATRKATAGLLQAVLARGKCAIIATHEATSRELFQNETRVNLDQQNSITAKDFGSLTHSPSLN